MLSANAFNLVTSKNFSFGNGLGDNKMLALSELKAFADEKYIVAKMLKFYLQKIFKEKEKVLLTSIFFLLPYCFQKASIPGLWKSALYC